MFFFLKCGYAYGILTYMFGHVSPIVFCEVVLQFFATPNPWNIGRHGSRVCKSYKIISTNLTGLSNRKRTLSNFPDYYCYISWRMVTYAWQSLRQRQEKLAISHLQPYGVLFTLCGQASLQRWKFVMELAGSWIRTPCNQG